MKIENPAAFQFFLPEDIYLINKDKTVFINKVPAASVNEIPVVTFNYLGANKKNFLVIVHYTDTEFIDDKHLTALENTIKRLGLSTDEIAVFNRARYPDVVFDDLVFFFMPVKLLFLGKNALIPNMETIQMNTLKAIGKSKALFTFGFEEMMDNTENKKVFWEQMKQL